MADFEIERPSVDVQPIQPTYNINTPSFTIEINGSTPGQRGEQGPPGQDGRDGVDGINGINGIDGQDGVSVTSIEQTTTSTESGGTNIITATLSNGDVSTFEIMNGLAGTGIKALESPIIIQELEDGLYLIPSETDVYGVQENAGDIQFTTKGNAIISITHDLVSDAVDPDTKYDVASYYVIQDASVYVSESEFNITPTLNTTMLSGAVCDDTGDEWSFSEFSLSNLGNVLTKNDVIDNLTSSVTNKPLSAAQGKALKDLLDAIVIPTNTSDLNNDSGFITSETDPIFSASAAAGISSSDISNWNSKSNFSGSYNDLTDKPTLFSGDYADLTNKPTIPDELSDLTDDTTHRLVTDSEKTTWSGKQDALVSGTNIKTINSQSLLGSGNIDISGGGGGTSNYNDLTNKPSINNVTLTGNKTTSDLGINIPTKTSDLTNDSGYISGLVTLEYGTSTWQDFQNAYNSNKVVYCKVGGRMAFLAYISASNVEFQYYRSLSSPTVSSQPDEVYVYSLTSANKWTTTTRKASSTIAVGTGLSRSYTASSRTMTLSADTSTMAQKSDLPTKVSDLTNDSGYITGYTETDPVYSASAASGITSTDITNWNNKSDFSGSYTDLTDKPTIPTVNNATLTIQKNGTTVKTFTANASSNVTANITVPTQTSDLTNNSGYITNSVNDLTNYTPTNSLATVATSGSYNDLTNKPTIPTVPTNVSAFTNDSGYITGITSSDIYNVLGYYPAAEPSIYTYSSIRQITSISDGTYISLMDDITNDRPIAISLGATEYVDVLGTNNGNTTSLWYITSDNTYTKITLTVSGTSVTVTTTTIEIPTATSDLTNDSNFAVTNADNNFSTSQTIDGSVVTAGNVSSGGKTAASSGRGVLLDGSGGIEISHSSTPYIDFHYANSSGDFTSRLFEESSGVLKASGALINAGNVLHEYKTYGTSAITTTGAYKVLKTETITFHKGRVLVLGFTNGLSVSSGNGGLFVGIDGTNSQLFTTDTKVGGAQVGFSLLGTPSAGSHTITMGVFADGGATATISAYKTYGFLFLEI